jgi:hypothetical protein
LDCWSSRANHSYLGTFVTEFWASETFKVAIFRFIFINLR